MLGAATDAADPPSLDLAPPTPAGGRSWWDRLVRLMPGVVPGAVMLVLGLIGAHRPVLSWDEVATADVARRSPAEIWQLTQHIDAVFGAYYLFMHGWTRVAGESELALRLPSILAMAATVAAAGELGRRLFDPLTGAVTGLFLCVLPNTSRYAAEARPYAFACLMSVLALLALAGALERGRPLRWAGYGLTVVLLGLGHIVALATLGAHAALVAIRLRRGWSWRIVAAWGTTLAIALALLTPLALLGIRQQDAQLSWVDPVTVAGLGAILGQVVGSSRTAWLLLGLALLAHWRPASALVPVALLALTPVAVVAAVSALVASIWVPRYLLVVLVPLAMLAAVTVVGQLRVDGRAGAGAPGDPRRRAVLRARGAQALRLIVILVALAGTAYPGQRAVRAPNVKSGPDYRAMAGVVQRHQLPGDGIVYEARSRAMRAGVQYYLRRRGNSPQDLLHRRPAAEVGRLIADEHPDAAARVTGVRRVWLLVGGVRDDPTIRRLDLRPLLGERYERLGIWHVTRGTVALYRYRG